MSRPLIAILRGIEPRHAKGAACILVDEGFTRIEVPLNSQQPLKSIERMVSVVGPEILVGAGTVSDTCQVKAVAESGGRIIVSPNSEPNVIRTAKLFGMESWPGVLTISDCMSSLAAGADGLKLFPASVLGPHGARQLKQALPNSVQLIAVGGADTKNLRSWIAAGIDGFGIGAALFEPGIALNELRHRARRLIKAYDEASSNVQNSVVNKC